MPVPSAVNADYQDPNVVNMSNREDIGASPTSSSAPRSQSPPNFSRPLPLSPPGTTPTPVNPANPPPVQSTGSSSNIHRPLPSIPTTLQSTSRQSPEHVYGGRGSGLGIRIIDDRDPDNLSTTLAPPHSRSPNYNYEDDGRTSSAASDSEVQYASAPSTPLPITVELDQEHTAEALSQDPREAARREQPERRATVALGETRRDHREGSLTPKRAATVDTYGKGTAPNMPVPEVPKHPQISQEDDDALELEYSDDIDPYLRKLVEHYGDDPKVPGSFVEDHKDNSPPSFPKPQPPPIVLGLPAADTSSPTSPQSDNGTVTMSMPSFISFPTPFRGQRESAWKSYASSSLHGVPALGDQQEQFDLAHLSQDLSPSVISGTDLEFEPLPSPYEDPVPNSSPHVGAAKSLSNPQTLPAIRDSLQANAPRPLPPFPTKSPQPGEGQGARISPESHVDTPGPTKPESGDAVVDPATKLLPTAPLRITKSPRTPTSAAPIPQGTAPSGPPAYSSSPDLPIGQGTSVQGVALPVASSSTSKPGQLSSMKDNIRTTGAQNTEPFGTVTIIPMKQSLSSTSTKHSPGLIQGKSSGNDSKPQSSDPSPPTLPKLIRPVTKNTSLSIGGTPLHHTPQHQGYPVATVTSTDARIGREREDAPLMSSIPASEKPTEPRLRRQSGARARIPPRPSELSQDAALGHQPHSESQEQQRPVQPQSQPQPLRPGSGAQSPPPPPPPSKPRALQPSRPPTTSVPNSSAAPSVARKRVSQSDTPPHQPQTLAEEKAQYNAIPPSSRSQYMQMLLALDDIPMIYNLSASFFTWILLAGFILFPGTFTNLKTLNVGNGFEADVVNSIVNLPLFVVAFICTAIGVIGMAYLWWKWMKNYIWLVNKIFLPGLMNSLAGVISTLASIYGAQEGQYSKSSIITISVTGSVGVVCGILVLFYGVWMLGRVKKRHAKEIGIVAAGKHGEGVWAGFKQKVGRMGKGR